MAYGVSTRTLFLLVRGVYMGRPLQRLQKDMKGLTKAQQKMIREQQRMREAAYRTAYGALFEGVAYLSFASMVTIAFTKIMEKSREGSRFMALFGKSVDKSLGRIGEALTKMLGPSLNTLATLLEIITSFKPALYALTFLVTVGTMMLMVVGIAKLLSGAFAILGLKTANLSMQLPILNIQLAGTTAAMAKLVTVMSVGFGIFMVVYQIVSLIAEKWGVLPAIIAAVTIAMIGLVAVLKIGATAMSIMTFGAAALAGLAAIAPLLTMPTYQTGTTFVRRTGLAYVHAGEIIKSARESSDFGYLKTGQQRITYNTITVKIDNVHTKADIDDLDEKLRRAFKDYLEQKV